MRPVVFAGPSIFGLDQAGLDLDFRPPASSGDLLAAVREGAATIGLIDGLYGDCAAVWHKEILHALSKGVRVLGAASMGALRAAECVSFGMVGVGRIFEAYRDGERFSDADVAVTHAPAELGYRPLSVALVDAQATLASVSDMFHADEIAVLLDAARSVHFSQRTWRSVVLSAGLGADHLHVLKSNAISVKRQDAEQLLNVLAMGDLTPQAPGTWNFQNTIFFQELLKRSPSLDENR
ncbi:MAG: TfuA-like protein [Rhizobium sp.]|nr:TfuA-like protein [Rhizobium sp.]